MKDSIENIVEQDQDLVAPPQSNSLQNEAAIEISSRRQTAGDRDVMLDSLRTHTVGTRIGDTDLDKEMSATIFVRSKASEREIDETLKKITAREMKPLSNDEFNQKFAADPESMERVLAFARENGLTVKESELESGKVLLKGTVGDFSKAFEVHFDDFQTDDGKIVRERLGTISLPGAIATDVQSVIGLDNRTQAKALFQKQQDEQEGLHSLIAPPKKGFMPNQIADAYEFPKESLGKGQSVAIIELGGGLDVNDNARYYSEHGLKLPNIQLLGVDGAKNSPGQDADGEVALDSQMIGAVAPDAHQQLIFAPNSEQGFVDAITRATFAKEGETQNTAISISWGARESSWDAQGIKTMDLAFKKAALKGISVFAAAGDAGAGNTPRGQQEDGKFVADFPASDPWVTASGGTRLTLDSNGKPQEVVWNDNKSSSGGGGVSGVFEKPDFQNGIDVPVNPKPANPNAVENGRGVPDVAGDASPETGYIIRVDGKEQVIGGTSAVAPLYAALVMRVNGALGQPVGFLNPFLYRNRNNGIFNDITIGNNNGFNAKPGWDAASGLGSIRGTAFLNQFRKDLAGGANSLIA